MNNDSLKHFTNFYYQNHNLARLQHLESLELNLRNKKVVEFGAGIGDHSHYFLIKNCDILPTEGRLELAEYIAKRFNIDTRVFDVENDLDEIYSLGYFDIVHCYGLLYHITNPGEFLDSTSKIGKTLLLESCVSSDDFSDGVYVTAEPKNNPTQALNGHGCRPTRNWIYNKLLELYKYVYCPLTQPKHHEFPINWTNSMDVNALKRAVFVASHNPINNKNLAEYLPSKYNIW